LRDVILDSDPVTSIFGTNDFGYLIVGG